MQYGDEIQVLANGPIISPKALQPLGIADGSTCWGIWTGGPPSRNKNRQRARWQFPHLVISPLHPESWANSFHLRVVLRDEPGSLFRFLESVEDCGIDLQFADCSFAGYDRVVLNSMGQFEDLRNWRSDFVDFYKSTENRAAFNKLWHEADQEGQPHLPDWNEEFGNSPMYERALMKALHFPFHKFGDASGYEKSQRLASKMAIDAMRLHAMEWLGRKMLARLTAVWVVVRLKEYKLYQKGWKREEKKGLRKRNKDGTFDFKKDLDPVGDYFFTSKTVQTGRRPWNVELPFAPSWSKEQRDAEPFPPDPKEVAEYMKERREAIKSLWEAYPSLLQELEDDKLSWFRAGEKKIKKLYKAICETKDLVHATRATRNKLRPSREAELALQHPDANCWINAITERILRNNWILPMSAHALYELAHASILRRDEEPIEFRYDANLSQMVVQNPDALKTAFMRFWNEGAELEKVNHTIGPIFPRVAVAAFSTKERFLRLKFIERETSDTQIVSIDIKFRVFRQSQDEKSLGRPCSEDVEVEEESSKAGKNVRKKELDGKAAAKLAEKPLPRNCSSQGLLQLLCKAALENKLDLLRVTTRTRAKFPNHGDNQVVEDGVVKLVGRLHRPRHDGDLNRLEKWFRECIHDAKLEIPFRDHIRLEAKAIPWKSTQVFWSSVFSHDRHEEVFNLAREIGQSFGLNVVKTESRVSETTRMISDEIAKSDAVLQLVCLRDADRLRAQASESWQPEYVWLHSEYAMALALKKPVIRLIDDSMPERMRNEFDKVDRDVAVEQIDLRSSAATLKAKIEDIMRELRAKLGNEDIAKQHGANWP